MPPWSSVWADVVVDPDRCRSSGDGDKYWRVDADSAVTECDEENNEQLMSAPGC